MVIGYLIYKSIISFISINILNNNNLGFSTYYENNKYLKE